MKHISEVLDEREEVTRIIDELSVIRAFIVLNKPSHGALERLERAFGWVVEEINRAKNHREET